MATRYDVIKAATKDLGAGGSKFWKAYGLPAGSHWCCAAIWYWFQQAGASRLFFDGKKTAYVPTAQMWLKANCKKVKKVENAREGDIVVFTWSGNGYNKECGSRDHIGFIEKPGNSKHIYTIEGNTGAASPSSTRVMHRIREVKYVYGIYRPKYDHTNGWQLRDSAKFVTNYMMTNNFKYQGSKNALTWAKAKKQKTTNCASMVSYALQRKGFLKPGEVFYINGDRIVCKGGLTEKKLKKLFDISHPHKSPKKCNLVKGAICGYKNNPHTQIFAGWSKDGRPKWYSTGCMSDIRSGKAHVKKSYNEKKIDTIMYLKN